MNRHTIELTPIRAGLLAAMFCVNVLQVGCESTPIRSFRAAQHYAAGSRALERNQSDRAILELERAAALVPHASEIQNHLGLAYWSAGRRDPARAAFERAIAADCENQAAEANLVGLLRSSGGDETGEDGAGGEIDGG